MGRGGEPGDEIPAETLLYGRPLPRSAQPEVFLVEIFFQIEDAALLKETLDEFAASDVAELFFAGDQVLPGTWVLERGESTGRGEGMVQARVKVVDRQMVIAGAISGYQESFFDEDWRPAGVGEALAEAYGPCSGLPSPDQIGIALKRWRARPCR